jgi:hypothetical protein
MTITRGYRAEMTRRHLHRANWGNSAKNYGGGDVLHLLDRFDNLKTILDFGCGKGTMREYVEARTRRKDLKWTEYDPGISGKDTLPQGRFDMVVSCDVLEHIEPNELDKTLQQLKDWTGLLSYHNIACSPTGHKFADGEHEGKDVHLIVEPPTWWNARLGEAFTPEMELWEFRDCIRRAKSGKPPRPRATLIHERIKDVRPRR